jgi:dienelactone hydrolase
MSFVFFRALQLLGLLLLAGAGQAAEPALNAAWREQVVMLPKSAGLLSTELETTLFRPPGSGPFPVLIINHGKAAGDPKFQPRYRAEVATREFLQRNYLVVLPMRQGFSRSSGNYIGGGCNVESNGRAQAEDVLATLNYLKTVADADLSRVVVLGQSHGGLTTLALGSLNYPGVRGLINFAGGLRQENCAGWESVLARALGSYARDTHAPSLWFYGDNDSYFQPWLFREMHKNYLDAGGQARLVAFGAFGSDSHALFGSRTGLPIWLPEVEKFLAELGLPSQAVHRIALALHDAPVPAATAFAPLAQERALPQAKQAGQDGYLKYLDAEAPKAYALSPNGAWAYSSARSSAMRTALERCNEFAKDHSCRLYAVDDAVVWAKE